MERRAPVDLFRRHVHAIYNYMKYTYNISTAQAQLPRLVRQAESGKPISITKRDEPVAYLVSRAHFEAIVETLEIMSDPAAMRILRRAKSGKLKYAPVGVLDEDEG